MTPRIALAQLRYHLLMLARTPRALFAGLLFPSILLLLRGHAGDAAGTVAALTGLGVLSTAYLSHAAALVAARESGVLRRWRLSPLPGAAYFTFRALATALLAAATAVVLVAVATVSLSFRPTPAEVADLVGVVTLGSLAWAALGTAASAAVPTTESAQPVLSLTFYPLLLLSGALGDVATPAWLTAVLRWLPAEPLIDAAQHALEPSGAVGLGSGRDLAVLAAWAMLGLVASRRWFRWSPRC